MACSESPATAGLGASRKTWTLSLSTALILLGVVLPSLIYVFSYRPARKAYDAKAEDVDRQLAAIRTDATGWGEVGQTMIAAGYVDLANTAIDELNEQNKKTNELKAELRRSSERSTLQSASKTFVSFYFLGVALIAAGAAGIVEAVLRLRRVSGMLVCLFGGALAGGLAAYLWWSSSSPLDQPYGVGEVVLPAIIVGGLVGAAGALVAALVNGPRNTASSRRPAAASDSAGQWS